MKESNVFKIKDDDLECVLKFCYFGGTLGAGEGAKDATRAKVKSAWTRIKELSPILSACGAPKGKIYRQSLWPECVDIWD